jgi:hypothetical protein
MLFLGFSAGIPLLLIFSSLSLWLREAGVERNAVTFFSWAALGYSFKFVWAPLVDRLPLPWLTRALWASARLAAAGADQHHHGHLLMASVDPAAGRDALVRMALAAVMLGFSAATQDICIDAYRIESGRRGCRASVGGLHRRLPHRHGHQRRRGAVSGVAVPVLAGQLFLRRLEPDLHDHGRHHAGRRGHDPGGARARRGAQA